MRFIVSENSKRKTHDAIIWSLDQSGRDASAVNWSNSPLLELIMQREVNFGAELDSSFVEIFHLIESTTIMTIKKFFLTRWEEKKSFMYYYFLPNSLHPLNTLLPFLTRPVLSDK